MKKTRTIFWTVLALFLLLLVTIPVAAGPGGGVARVIANIEDTVGGIPGINFSVYAERNAAGAFAGSGFLHFPPFESSFSIEVTNLCTGFVPSNEDVYPGHKYAVIIGKLTVLSGDAELDEGGFAAISVVQGRGTEPDAMVVFMNIGPSSANDYCAPSNTTRHNYHIYASEGWLLIQGN